MWAGSFDRELDDIFAIQSDIAKGVAEALKLRLLSPERRASEPRPSSSTEAFSLYLKGQVELNRADTEEKVNRALRYFTEALAKDPDYAPAHVGVAYCFHELEHVGTGSVKGALEKSKDAAETAIRLDPQSAEAHEAICPWFAHNADWGSAEREHRRALELNPNLVEARRDLSEILRLTGRPMEALEQARRAVEIDPLSYVTHLGLGEEYHTKADMTKPFFT